MTEYFGRFYAYNAEATSGLVCKGYTGCVAEERYVYFSPFYDGANYHGRVLRYNKLLKFKDAAAWDAYDAGSVGGLNSKGFWGAVYDGRHVYFVPSNNSGGYHGIILRLYTAQPFSQASAWAAFNASATGGRVCKGYRGGVFDGRYVYFVPYYNGTAYHAVILRYDTTQDFNSSASWASFDAGSIGGLVTKGYDGGHFDGRYIYFAPSRNAGGVHGVVLRYDTSLPFDSASSYDAYNLTAIDAQAKCFAGPAGDESYLYLPSADYSYHHILRYDLTKPFKSAASWDALDLDDLTVYNDDYIGCSIGEKYIVFASTYSTVIGFSLDQPFSDPASWSVQDAHGIDGLESSGYAGAASDFNYFYFAPFRRPAGSSSYTYHGIVLRLRRNPCPNQSPPNPHGSQDLTKYQEKDVMGDVSRTVARCTISTKQSGYWTFVYRDYGRGAFDAVDIDFDVRVTGFTSDDQEDIQYGVLCLSNYHGELTYLKHDLQIAVTFEFTPTDYYEEGDPPEDELSLFLGGYYDSVYAISLNTTYYCKLTRSAGSDTAYLRIYSNAARTSLLSMITITGSGATKWRYIYVFRGSEDGSTNGDMASLYVENVVVNIS